MNVQNRDASKSVNENVTMDSRKFLSMINGSAQSQVVFFEGAIQKLGAKRGQKWQLSALLPDKVVIEDIENQRYFLAEHSRKKGGRVSIGEIKEIDLHEGKKGEIFESSCRELVDAIEEDDKKKVDQAFNKIASSRFRGTVIPESGVVRTKDGIIRKVAINESTNSGIDLGNRIVTALSDKIAISESGELSGTFVEDSNIDLPDLHLINRKVVAHHMREAALGAHWSGNFQTLTESVAGYVSNGRLEEAVQHVSKFLFENQEFSLLNREQLQSVIGNALAARGVFSNVIVENVTTLIHKTGLKVNKADIVSAWQNTALQTENPVVIEEIRKLEAAEDFPKQYDEFLHMFYEGTTEITSRVLVMALKHIKDQVAGSDEVEPGEIDALISELENGADKESEIRAMEVIKTVDDGLDILSSKGLDEYDSLSDEPDPVNNDADTGVNGSTEDNEQKGDGNTTNITINTGGDVANVDTDEDLGEFDEFTDDTDDNKDEGDGGDEEDSDVDVRLEEDKQIDDAVQKTVDEMMNEDEDDEGDDDYNLPDGLEKLEINTDYNGGEEYDEECEDDDEVVTEDAVSQIQSSMRELSIDDDDAEGIYSVVKAYVDGKYDSLSNEDQESKVNSLTGAVASKASLKENQHKVPTKQLSRRGLKRAAVNELVTEGELLLDESEEDNVATGAYKDTKFRLQINEGTLLLSDIDGNISIPVPDELNEAALYSVELARDKEVCNEDVTKFINWLNESILQLQPVGQRDDDALSKTIDEVIDGDESDESDINGESEVAGDESDGDESDGDESDGDESDGDDE